MSVRGKNSDGLLTQRISDTILGNSNPASGAIFPIWSAVRTSLFVKEAGATIVSGGGGTNATTGAKLHPAIYVQEPGSAAVLLASVSGTDDATASEIAAAATVGSEFTTRDATFKFATAYENASSRVFKKGTKIFGRNTSISGGAATDAAIVYIQVEEFGAPPA
jgi:hypothetical protein